ncbi:MAG: ParB/RepB/Spo0J family partition protein [Oscillospiraceae bacterium]|nr:ParB/RepB/Spo0J family partition protein [Oscillospiraceae bacterium]
MNDKIQIINLRDLRGFPKNPFKVREDEAFNELVMSIRENGLISPLVVRPHEEGGYEIISGHRRRLACEKAGLTEVPVLIYTLDRDSAAIALVDSNLHRENILPSEKAFAYKLKLEALSRQGKRTDLTSAQVGRKLETAEMIGEQVGESKNQIRRYIRLTHLVPELLDLVDDKRIAFTPAVELSYLTEQEQYTLLDTIESEDCTPSLSQAQRMKKLSQEGRLTAEVIFAIMSEEKPNQREKIKLSAERVREYFPKSYTTQQMEDIIFKLLEQWHRQQQRKRNDAR